MAREDAWEMSEERKQLRHELRTMLRYVHVIISMHACVCCVLCMGVLCAYVHAMRACVHCAFVLCAMLVCGCVCVCVCVCLCRMLTVFVYI